MPRQRELQRAVRPEQLRPRPASLLQPAAAALPAPAAARRQGRAGGGRAGSGEAGAAHPRGRCAGVQRGERGPQLAPRSQRIAAAGANDAMPIQLPIHCCAACCAACCVSSLPTVAFRRCRPLQPLAQRAHGGRDLALHPPVEQRHAGRLHNCVQREPPARVTPSSKHCWSAEERLRRGQQQQTWVRGVGARLPAPGGGGCSTAGASMQPGPAPPQGLASRPTLPAGSGPWQPSRSCPGRAARPPAAHKGSSIGTEHHHQRHSSGCLLRRRCPAGAQLVRRWRWHGRGLEQRVPPPPAIPAPASSRPAGLKGSGAASKPAGRGCTHLALEPGAAGPHALRLEPAAHRRPPALAAQLGQHAVQHLCGWV